MYKCCPQNVPSNWSGEKPQFTNVCVCFGRLLLPPSPVPLFYPQGSSQAARKDVTLSSATR